MGSTKNANYKVKNIKYNYGSTNFDLIFKDKNKNNKKIKNINVKLLGKHNVLNSAAALIVCLNLGADLNIAKKSLKKFFWSSKKNDKSFFKK